MNFEKYTDIILKLKEDDLILRAQLLEKNELNGGYNRIMEEMHNRNAGILNDIMDEIGYPTIDKVGTAASDAAWMIIQHAIGQPDFMKKSLVLLEEAVEKDEANPLNLAYLKDRIATFQGDFQLYGSAYDWDENGELSPKPYDDIDKVNQRRKALNLNTVEEQTQIMRDRLESENQKAPADMADRKKRYDEWRKKVGWI